MLSPERAPNLAPLSIAATDYEVVRKAIAYISEHWRTQPEVEEIACRNAFGVSPAQRRNR